MAEKSTVRVVVSGRGGYPLKSGKSPVFRSASNGMWVTKVMSADTFERASRRASTILAEAESTKPYGSRKK
jgi:hypothetical protein